nr:glycosyltransferase [uncultured Lachnoclostridium sp.]
MKQDKLISIIVPIYNVERFLGQCIESIINQTYRNLEIILINDGSTDNSLEICQFYNKLDDRIILVNKKNEGLGATYNLGIKKAKGEYIGLVEPDDYIDSDMYEVLLSSALKYSSDLTKCGLYNYNSLNNTNIIHKDYLLGTLNQPIKSFQIDDFKQLYFYHSSVWSYLYKSSFIKQFKFLEKKGAAYVDALFAYKVLTQATSIYIVPRCFYHWRVEGQNNSISLTDERILALIDSFYEIKEYLLSINKFNDLREEFFYHCICANLDHYRHIESKYKKEYKNKLRDLCRNDLLDNNFQWKYFPLSWKNEVLKIIR